MAGTLPSKLERRPRTRTGRSRLEHRQGWQDAVWTSVPVAKTRTGRSRLEHRHGWQGAGMARRDQSIFYTLFNEITTRLLGSAPSLKVEILASSCKEV